MFDLFDGRSGGRDIVAPSMLLYCCIGVVDVMAPPSFLGRTLPSTLLHHQLWAGPDCDSSYPEDGAVYSLLCLRALLPPPSDPPSPWLLYSTVTSQQRLRLSPISTAAAVLEPASDGHHGLHDELGDEQSMAFASKSSLPVGYGGPAVSQWWSPVVVFGSADAGNGHTRGGSQWSCAVLTVRPQRL